MPRRKQHCPKRMKYDEADGDGTTELNNHETQESKEHSNDERSDDGRLSPGSPPTSPSKYLSTTLTNSNHATHLPHSSTSTTPDQSSKSISSGFEDNAGEKLKGRYFPKDHSSLKMESYLSPDLNLENNSLESMKLMSNMKTNSVHLPADLSKLLSVPKLALSELTHCSSHSAHKNNNVKVQKQVKKSVDPMIPLNLSKTMPNKSLTNDNLLPKIESPEQPLDLSCKSHSGSEIKNNKYLNPNLDLASASSTLGSLEQKFGSHSQLLEKASQRSHSNKNTTLSFGGFGGSIFSSALFHSSGSLGSSAQVKAKSFWPKIAPRPPTPKVSTSTTLPANVEHQKTPDHRTATSSKSPLAQTTSPRPLLKDSLSSPYRGRYTSLSCTCKKQFESLYEMTKHLQKTGHKPAHSKREEHGEYPKLVRGQDMWLSQGSEQTRQILRCMQCGESFKTLPELTMHMMKSKHYTDIVGNSAQPTPDLVPLLCKTCKPPCTCNKLSKTVKSPTAKLTTDIHQNYITPKIEDLQKDDQDDSDSEKELHIDLQEEKSNEDSDFVKKEFGEDEAKEESDDNKIRCENCSKRISTGDFVEHVRLCIRKDPKSKNEESDCDDPECHDKSMNKEAPSIYDIYQPLDSSSETESSGSALQAMEKFINRSFMVGKGFMSKDSHRSNVEVTTPDSTQSMHSSNASQPSGSYRPVSEGAKNIRPYSSEPKPSSPIIKKERKRSHSGSADHVTDNSVMIDDKSEHSGAYLDTKRARYLTDEETADGSGASSAIESLHGLVYGKSLSTEHPLDSLQKLIHSTDTGASQKPVVSQSVLTSSDSVPPHLANTVILVNPIVTVMPNSQSGLRIEVSPKDDEEVKMEASVKVETSQPEQSSPSSPEKLDLELGEELRCQACKRNFASKGSYRYHLSRCHLSSVKKYGIKEAFNMSPYVYLPLDHSAKFNKYYEMANELANKSK